MNGLANVEVLGVLPMRRSTESWPLTFGWPPTGNTAVRHTNAGRHYLTAEVTAFRNSVHYAMLAHHIKPVLGQYRMRVEFAPPDNRRRDMDNALKTVLDALRKAGLVVDDDMGHMRELVVTVALDAPVKGGRVRVWVEPLFPKGAAA